ncbi:helicase-exonuclease AddAB subunit AddB [Paenibacillus koleovorans]|uniref:helicase-exonuclease AddAB subunit AddB n=1 Tax=Paenibacillus koleovorans TaxID=121608 RepID=UPI000FD9C620|nr:helicase-exonuclease AddAB subunit AddB [Paenibacillus koleovorans]
MAIRYILGRAGTGKTRRCLDEIRDRLLQAPEGDPLILLVPEQATFQAEATLVGTPGLDGMIRAQVLSFHRLAFRVMQETGGMARIHIDDSGKAMLLHRLLQQHKDELRLFGQTADRRGFIEHLNKLFTEFRRYGIDEDKLNRHVKKHTEQPELAGTTADKLHDIRHIYGRFQAFMNRHYVDSEDYLSLLAEQIGYTSSMARADVWVDGFHGFTPQEFVVLERLMKNCRSVTITLCVDRDYGPQDRPDELDPFHPTARTLIRLKQIAEQVGAEQVDVQVLAPEPAVRYRHSPMLAYLETNFGDRTATPFAEPAGRYIDISVQSAVNRRAEVEGLAREMIRQVRENGYRWRDMAVLVRNMEHYRDLLAVTLEDSGIPFFFDQKRSLLHHPLSELIRAALEVVSGNWRHDAVFRCVKTELLLPLMRAGSAPEDSRCSPRELRDGMCQLENIVLAMGIQGGSRWREPRRWEPARLRMQLEDGGVEPVVDQRLTELLHHCRQLVVSPLSALEQAMKAAKSVEEMAQALYIFLEQLQVPAKLERLAEGHLEAGRPEAAREHSQVWGSAIDLLDQIVEMLGTEKLTLPMFAELIETGLDQLKLALVPPALDQVLIGSMDRTRSSRIKRAYVLGANDGVLPAKLKEDGLLSENERELLIEGGMEMAEGNRRKLLDEQFLIYTALTTPSHHLWISYPLADEEGGALLPSEIVKRVRRLFPNALEQMLLSEPATGAGEEETSGFIAHPGKALSMLAVQLREWIKGRAIPEIWWEVYNWFAGQPDWQPRLRQALHSLFATNREPSLSSPVSRALYGERLRASVSRLERFVACPFSQFASHGLKLSERRVYKLESPDIGQLFHAALSRVAQLLASEDTPWGALSHEQLFSLAAHAVDELAPRLQAEILLSSNRHRYVARKLKMIVGRAAAVLGEHAKHGAFEPVGLELGFGPGQPLPPLEFRLDNGSVMEMIGRIDRVDRAEGEQGMLLRVIDYKSSPTELKMSDVYYGLSLQMLTYLDVVITHAERWLGREAKPAGVLYFHVHNPMLQKKNRLTIEQAEAELLKRFKMRGLLLEELDAVQLMDRRLASESGQSTLIPAGLKTDGSFYKTSAVASIGQWNSLRSYVRSVLQQIGNQITDGRVDIKPYRLGPKLACTFCPYKPVCRFEPAAGSDTYNRLKVIGKSDVWQAIEAKEATT